MTDEGTVLLWHVDDGWGVIESPATPGGCWAHFSALAIEFLWEPQPGARITFEWEPAQQDGFEFRATRAWPAGSEPFDHDPEPAGSAYGSSLSINFDS